MKAFAERTNDGSDGLHTLKTQRRWKRQTDAATTEEMLTVSGVEMPKRCEIFINNSGNSTGFFPPELFDGYLIFVLSRYAFNVQK